MTFNFDQEILDIYNITMSPTKPKFSVGDIVYCKAQQSIPGYNFNIETSTEEICERTNRDYISEYKIIIEPAIFGIIINIPDEHVKVLASETLCSNWFSEHEWDLENSESIIDIEGSGSVWFLPDEERKYFVKWLNKTPYSKIKLNQEIPFQPLKENNISLHFEQYLFKAPNFPHKIKSIANKNKERTTLEILNNKLNIDKYSINGIKNIINTFSQY